MLHRCNERIIVASQRVGKNYINPKDVMNDNDVIYAIEVSDIQAVAQESLDRDLSDSELKFVITEIEKHIAWHDIVDDVITRNISAQAA